jgi:hypothetical protein
MALTKYPCQAPASVSGTTITPPQSLCFDISGTYPMQLGAIPDASFFNLSGIFSQRTIAPYATTFDSLYAYYVQLAPLIDPSAVAVDPFGNATSATQVKWLSAYQKQKYSDQIRLFQQVYTYNKTAYELATIKGGVPLYYRFRTSEELTAYKSAVQIINKLYNVSAPYMVVDNLVLTKEFAVNCLFFLPFPPFCQA